MSSFLVPPWCVLSVSLELGAVSPPSTCRTDSGGTHFPRMCFKWYFRSKTSDRLPSLQTAVSVYLPQLLWVRHRRGSAGQFWLSCRGGFGQPGCSP